MLFRSEVNKSCKTLNRLRKLLNSNLEILKFEARFAYAVKFWTDFFDLKSAKFSTYDILSKLGNLLLFHRNTMLLDIYVLEGRGNKKVVTHSSGLQKFV